MVAEVIGTVKTAVDYGVDVGALWGAARLVIGIGVMGMAVTAGIIFYRKLTS